MIARRASSPQRSKPLPRVRAKPRTHRCQACSARTSSKVCPNCGTRKATKLSSVGSRWDTALRKWTLVRADHRCERCGVSLATLILLGAHLEDAHYEERRHHATRWHPDNRAALCVGPHERHGGCHRIIDNYTPAHERRAFFVSKRGEKGIAEVDELHRHPWDRDMGAIVRLLVQRGVLKAKEGNRD